MADLPNQCGSGEYPGGHVFRLDEQAALRVPQEIGRVHCLISQAQDWLSLTIQDIACVCPQRYLILSYCGESPMCHEIHNGPSHLCAETQ